jgi:hypothetical protein
MSHRGGLLELIARGKKDAFFHANPQVSFFHSVYKKYAAITEEIHLTTPRNQPEWGKWLEFDLEHRGDLVRKFHLRITLPTWLPPAIAAANPTSLITDASGVSFGYCNNVGYQMIDKIQIYQDQVLLQELYGEYLDWKVRQSVSFSSVLVMSAAVGSRDESALAIGRAATLPTLRVPIPILGWESVGDPGFPTVALRSQRFRIRILLRPLEAVVVASDGRLAPKPWVTGGLRIQRTAGGPQEPFTALPYEVFAKGLNMMLETTQVYVPCDVQEVLKTGKWLLPYRSSQHQPYTIQDYQMNAASTAVANFTMSFPLDFTGACVRVFAAFQQRGAALAGQRSRYLGNVATGMRINVANLDRIQLWEPAVFREVTSYWKNVRAAQDLLVPTIPLEVYTFVFGGKEALQPAGTLNFTRAAIPELWISFGPTPIDVRTQSRELTLLVYVETWEVLEVEGGKCRRVLLE